MDLIGKEIPRPTNRILDLWFGGERRVGMGLLSWCLLTLLEGVFPSA